ncbi:MAG: 2-oxoglutarate and iron-dependent oxygenase domain-containing protein, partial [Pseudomonadota bacterium]|nr:2-oxoglutarate and iron-dependent oxygenase domain-containing protein [Pseudomonadota bacterium]
MSDFDYASAETTDFTCIPIIDMPDLDAETGLNSPEFVIFAQALMSAATEVGFFYLRNHGVPENLREQAMAASRRFFALPEDIKQKIAVNSDQRGWMAKGGAVLQGAETFDAKEIFFWGWESEQMDTSLPLVAPNQWPDDEAAFLKAEIMAYYTAVLG